MNKIEFVYWLKEFLETNKTKILNKQQITIIKNNIDLVFDKNKLKNSSKKINGKHFATDYDFVKYVLCLMFFAWICSVGTSCCIIPYF